MKSAVIKLAIPLAIISFAGLTKWWYALPVDAPGTVFTGFPFPFVCNGWHTSLSLQIFVLEFFGDLLTYFLIWLLLLFCINRFIASVRVHKAIITGLWVLSGLIIAFAVFLASNKDNLIFIKRPFSMKVMKTGFQFGWQHKESPDFNQYNPEQKNRHR